MQHDARAVADSGTVDHKTGEPIRKPDVVCNYTQNIMLVDMLDIKIGSVEHVRKEVKG